MMIIYTPRNQLLYQYNTIHHPPYDHTTATHIFFPTVYHSLSPLSPHSSRRAVSGPQAFDGYLLALCIPLSALGVAATTAVQARHTYYLRSFPRRFSSLKKLPHSGPEGSSGKGVHSAAKTCITTTFREDGSWRALPRFRVSHGLEPLNLVFFLLMICLSYVFGCSLGATAGRGGGGRLFSGGRLVGTGGCCGAGISCVLCTGRGSMYTCILDICGSPL